MIILRQLITLKQKGQHRQSLEDKQKEVFYGDHNHQKNKEIKYLLIIKK